MKRRAFVVGLGGAAAWPLAARAQQRALPVVGYMHAGSAEANRQSVKVFEEALRQSGYVDGENIAIEYHWASGRYDRLPAFAADLVRRQVAVIVTGTPVAALAAKQATASIPIVFAVGSDPVRNGLVASLSRPGGNVTGSTFFSNLLSAKRLELLHELVPGARTFGALVNPRNANAQMQSGEAREAARALGVELAFVDAASAAEIDASFDKLEQRQAEALIVISDSFLNNQAGRIAKLALRHALPTCFAYREPVQAGGLMSYGANRTEVSRHAGLYVGRILKGEKPADLPVVQPTRFELVINLETAKALGLEIPATLLARADEVIE